MDISVFQTDAVKIDSIARLLRQADEILSDVKSHLHDYGERLGPAVEPSSVGESCEIEIEQLKQVVSEKEEESRIARLQRVQAFEEVHTLRETVANLEACLTAAEEKQKQLVATTVERRSDAHEQKQLLQSAQSDNARLRKENESLKRRLDRAHEHNERLLRTREELLDTLKLSDVVARMTPSSPGEPPSDPGSAEIILLESLETNSP
jgi:chromosome segregation ATPase